MKFHVLTAVSRPENMTQIASSICAAANAARDVDVTWHCRFDHERVHVGGQALKNSMLDEITDGWVVILDDDTLMHDRFFSSVRETVKIRPELSAIVVSQQRTTGNILVAAPQNVAVGAIDAGQAVIKRDLIANHRLPESYAGDGLWLETLLRGRDDVVYLSAVLSLHNVLTGIDVSEPPERMGA